MKQGPRGTDDDYDFLDSLNASSQHELSQHQEKEVKEYFVDRHEEFEKYIQYELN